MEKTERPAGVAEGIRLEDTYWVLTTNLVQIRTNVIKFVRICSNLRKIFVQICRKSTYYLYFSQEFSGKTIFVS